MRRLVCGKGRQDILDEVEGRTEYYGPSDAFDDLYLQQSQAIHDVTYIFMAAGEYDADQKRALESFLTSTDRNTIILASAADDLPQYITDHVTVEETDPDVEATFLDKISALQSDNYTREEVATLREIPLEYLLKRLRLLNPRGHPDLYKHLEYVNRRLYHADDTVLYDYLVANVNIGSRTHIFSKSDVENSYESLVERLSELNDMSEQEIARNLHRLVVENFDELDDIDGLDQVLGQQRFDQLKACESTREQAGKDTKESRTHDGSQSSQSTPSSDDKTPLESVI